MTSSNVKIPLREIVATCDKCGQHCVFTLFMDQRVSKMECLSCDAPIYIDKVAKTKAA